MTGEARQQQNLGSTPTPEGSTSLSKADFPPTPAAIRKRYLAAFDSLEIYPTLHRTCRELASQGVTQKEQQEELHKLLDWVRAIGAKQEYEDAVSDVMDSIEGFCPFNSRIYPSVSS